jgi:hypothetical protein
VLALLSRFVAALPDVITAGVFLITWIAPAQLGVEQIGNLMTVMLIEFFVVHSSGFYAGILAMTDTSRIKRALAVLGLAALYSIFMLVLYFVTKNRWPIFAFLWLLASRFVHVLVAPADSTATIERAVKLWAVSVASYVLGAIATILLPLPPLGITLQVIASLQLDSGGEWSARPYTVLAFGTLYFVIQAWAKFAMSRTAPARAARVSA